MYGTVVRVETLTPHLVRVVLGGEGLAEFSGSEFTDAYVNLLFLPPDAPYAVPFDPAEARSLERSLWPLPRRYTVRRWDAARRELWVDFVVHGDEGVAGLWATRTAVGDRLQLLGPGGGYAPDPAVRWHLMVGDESALPAIAAALERVPAPATALVVALVDGPADELPLTGPADLRVRWLHREAYPVDPASATTATALTDAVRDLEFPADDVQAFVHGEATETRAVRRHLLGDRGLPRERLSVSPYWRRTYTDERWREVKRAWLAEVESDT